MQSMEINAVRFRANCFKILDEVQQNQKEVIITKRGKPIAKLVHIAQETGKDPLLGAMPGAVETVSDLTEPVLDQDAWELD
jgi:prevent-host-death family protein